MRKIRPLVRLFSLATLLGVALANGALTPGAAAASGGRGFPVTIHAANGAVTFTAPPTRIMSLSPSATEMLYADGAGHQVVAVDKYSMIPKNAPRTNLTGGETSAESYLRYRPDLVVLGFEEPGLVHQLQLLHIPVLVMPPAANLSAAYHQFAQLGAATGHRAQAAREVAAIKVALARIVAGVGAKARVRGKTYYVEFSSNLYTATAKTFVGSLFGKLGMVNIANAAGKGGDGYPQLSAEYLLRANPDYVFLADDQCCGQSAATFAARPGFSGLRAVRLHHVFTVPDPIASEWGTQVVPFLAMIANDVKAGH